MSSASHFALHIRRATWIVFGFLAWQQAVAQTVLPMPDLGLMLDGGAVYAIAVQSDGKIVVGGDFSRVNGVPRNYIARLNADRTLDLNWNPVATGIVKVLAVSGSTVYAAGSFGGIGGFPRSFVAALNGTDGLATSWNAHAGGEVRAIVPAGPVVYVGGIFASMGGQPRNYIAALDATTGDATAWDPDADSAVFALAMAPASTTIYAGGGFANIGGGAHLGLAALDTTVNTNSAIATFNPAIDVNRSVLNIALSGTRLYIAGNFFNVNGIPRANLAAIDSTSGGLLPFLFSPTPPPTPSITPDGTINGLSVSGSTVYVGGNFGNIGGAARANIAALDATTGNALPWNPGSNFGLQSVVVSGTNVWVGGDFFRIGGAPAMQIALLDGTTGQQVAGFHPGAGTVGPSRSVYAQPDGKVLVGGGQFNWVGKVGVGRNNLLRLNSDGTLDLSWDPSTGPTQAGVYDFAVSGSNVYLAGTFAEMGGQSRNNLAAVDIVTGLATSWNPNADAFLLSISLSPSGTTLYAGGFFQNIGGQSRHFAAALDTASGNATGWNPNADNAVQKVYASGSTVYVGGFFDIIGGANRNRVAELDNTGGAATSWNPIADGSVMTFAIAGNVVYVGGDFKNIGGQPRNNAAALDKTSGLATNWNPNITAPFSTQVATLLLSGSKMYAGGQFSSIGGQPRNNLASLDLTTGNASPWNPNLGGSATGVAGGANAVYPVGPYASVLDQLRDGVAAISLDIALPPTLQGATSRKIHGGAGTFDLPL